MALSKLNYLILYHAITFQFPVYDVVPKLLGLKFTHYKRTWSNSDACLDPTDNDNNGAGGHAT